ncbi:AbrB family transcriptional regulator [Halovenus sp. WSH3]|uniref:AbrB family transcriptional regulator n=2 Tax=Halovenus carboxidivorans TaxID=2692199 RepID=A0A6B0SYE6_9EURY|nr:SpoVR family protein [Halovenus carboxidivorans]MXR50788.1 AbrB family transcriptional regulator [Halovenus carboxidivorans]
MQREAERLEGPVREAAALAKKLGLDPYPVNYWIVDYDEMNELIAYGGFQQRYPHWRWGMTYDRQQKQGQFLGGKAFEIVNNDNPAHAFLQISNSLADQKAVITHVEAHSDFFANNEWFGMFTDDPDAAARLARHGETIEEYMQDTDIERAEVEKWIDHILCLEDNIDQHQPYTPLSPDDESSDLDTEEVADELGDLELSEEVRQEVFDDEWLEARREDDDASTFPEEPERDILAFLRKHGRQYDPDAEKAVEMEEWQKEILEILRTEAYYFAPQKMTKVMNEGWASYWESLMMADENFADGNEFITYADHMSKVLGSGGLNPYSLGLQLWKFVENTANRRHVVEELLCIEGITWRNFHDTVDFEAVLSVLEPDDLVASVDPDELDAIDPSDPRIDAEALEAARDGEIDLDAYPWKIFTYEGMCERHYSLTKPENRGFISRISMEELEQISRYMFDDSKYESIEEALSEVDYSVGWDRMREIRESHNDVTFLDEFLTQEFVDEHNYFTYEYMQSSGDYRATSTDYQDVKKKLMLQFTNFGKPTIVVSDGNYRNRNELLLEHRYNGVSLDLEQAKDTLERVFELWGRPVALRTIVKEYDDHDLEVARRRDREPEPTEQGLEIRYNGKEFRREDLEWAEVEHLAATDIDYDTKPEEWLA